MRATHDMESERNKKLNAAEENWKKLSSSIRISKATWERRRFYRKIKQDSITSHPCNSPPSESLVIHVHDESSRQKTQNRINQSKLVMRALLLILLGLMMVETTCPSIFTEQDNGLLDLDAPIWDHLFELTVLLWAFWIMLCYIRDLFIKDRKEKLVLSPYGISGHYFGLLNAINLCICLTVQYANFQLHEDDRVYKTCTAYTILFCLLDYRESCYSTEHESFLLNLIEKIYSDAEVQLYALYGIRSGFSVSWVCWEQLSFTSRSRNAYYGMLLSIPAVFVSILELIVKCKREMVGLRRFWGIVWWFCYPDPDCRPFGTLTEIYGLISAIFQFSFSIVNYACYLLEVDNPIRLCPLPSIFLICVAVSTNQQSQQTQIISKSWIYLLTNIGLEILAATFEQLSSPSKLHYALYGMLLAIAAVMLSIWELIDKGKKEKVTWMRGGRFNFWWFYHPSLDSPPYTAFGTLPDIYGLIGGIVLCIFSIFQYVCYLRHVNNPIHICPLPTIFYLCASFSKSRSVSDHIFKGKVKTL